MEKYYIGDDIDQNQKSKVEKKLTLDYLKERVGQMNIYCEVSTKSPYRATVLVHKNVGTTMYLSSEFNDQFWLQENSVKREDAGGVVKYHFVLD